MELGFYIASTCFATQIASKNLLNKRTLFAKLKKHLLNKSANTTILGLCPSFVPGLTVSAICLVVSSMLSKTDQVKSTNITAFVKDMNVYFVSL